MAAQNNLVVAAIILIPPASSPFHAGHPEDGALIQHPDFNGGSYTMPNLTTIESANYYAAALDFMAQRYCGNDFSHGRIHHFIMHNEVDMGYSWTNMGSPTMETYVDTYVNSMRIAYNIVRQYDQNAEIFGSFAHSWAVANDAKSYVVKDMLDRINGYSHTEGDFRWALAYHSLSVEPDRSQDVERCAGYVRYGLADGDVQESGGARQVGQYARAYV